MFGVLALSEKSITEQGVVLSDSAALDAGFVQTTEANFRAFGSADLIGTLSKEHVGVGVLVGDAALNADFAQTSVGNFVRTGISDFVASFLQTTVGTQIDHGVDRNECRCHS